MLPHTIHVSDFPLGSAKAAQRLSSQRRLSSLQLFFLSTYPGKAAELLQEGNTEAMSTILTAAQQAVEWIDGRQVQRVIEEPLLSAEILSIVSKASVSGSLQ